MSSLPEIQQVPARHGTATFVPKGHVIKIINTYGRQVVDTWAFALPKPPSQEEMDEQNKQEEEVARSQEEDEKRQTEGKATNVQESEKKEEVAEEEGEDNEAKDEVADKKGEDGETKDDGDDKKAVGNEEEGGKQQVPEGEAGTGAEKTEAKAAETKEGDAGAETEQKAEGDDEQKGDRKGVEETAQEGENKETGDGTDDSKQEPEKKEEEESDPQVSVPETDGDKAKDTSAEAQKATPSKQAGWSSYIPSMPRLRGKSASGEASRPEQKTEQKAEKKPKTPAKAGEKRTWASYFSSGKGVSNYIPSNKSLSAFATSHYRDPTKSYAEQMYDFSMTPVGAGALSAASGSGYAGTAYAAYQAYTRKQEKSQRIPPMEYLSMPHCRVSTLHLVPKVNDTLVSNLRKPMLTVIEDTAAAHDTLIAACDPQRYRELRVNKWEEHGSCAENLVLALKELNQKAGLKGSKAIGTDVTVNTVPAPLNLFMNIPWHNDGTVSFEAPKGKKGEFIRLRAERDVVVVMSACPMDITPVNGGKCMAAHFLVQEPEKKTSKKPAAKKAAPQAAAKKTPGAASASASASTNATPQKAKPAAATPGKVGGPVKRPSQSSTPTQSSSTAPAPARKPSQPNAAPATNGPTARRGSTQPAPKAGRAKPKKLEKRMPSHTSSAQA